MDGVIHAQETFADKLGITKEQLKDTSKLTKEQRKELADLTKQYFETYKNVKKLSEVMEDNADILNNKSLKGTVEYDEALENVTKAVEKVTGAEIPTSLTEKL
jgi:RNA polymerase-binding transcription factor DksA